MATQCVGGAEDRRGSGCSRPSAEQPEPGSRLLHGVVDVLEVDAAGALQQVAAGRGHVAQLAGGAGQQRLRRAPGSAARTSGCGGEVAVARPWRRCAGRRRGSSLDLVERQPARRRRARSGVGDPELHVVDEVGAAAEEDARRVGRPAAATASGDVAGAARSRRASSARPPRVADGRRRCWRRRRSGTGCRSSARGSPRRQVDASAVDVRR